MAGQRSRDELIKFLNYVGSKGLLSQSTVESRKASVNKVLGILSEEEADDVSQIDLEQVIRRFANLHGQGYTADSLRTYKSRTKSSIDDFLRYVDNPMAFKVGGTKRERKSKPSNGASESPKTASRPESSASDSVNAGTIPPSAGTAIVPIAIRNDVIVRVQGLPFDLSPREAKKIANVILAMAMESD